MIDEDTARTIGKLFGVPTGLVLREDPFESHREASRRFVRAMRKMMAAQDEFNRVMDKVIPPEDRTG